MYNTNPSVVGTTHAIVSFTLFHNKCFGLIFSTCVKKTKGCSEDDVIKKALVVLNERIADGVVSNKKYKADDILKSVPLDVLVNKNNWKILVDMDGGYGLRHAQTVMAERIMSAAKAGMVPINRKHYIVRKTY